MHKIIFFRNKNGDEPLAEYILTLRKNAISNKNYKIKHNKIISYTVPL